MSHSMSLSSLSPAVIVFLLLALACALLGPFVLLALKGSRLHRGFGHAWITLMLGAKLS